MQETSIKLFHRQSNIIRLHNNKHFQINTIWFVQKLLQWTLQFLERSKCTMKPFIWVKTSLFFLQSDRFQSFKCQVHTRRKQSVWRWPNTTIVCTLIDVLFFNASNPFTGTSKENARWRCCKLDERTPRNTPFDVSIKDDNSYLEDWLTSCCRKTIQIIYPSHNTVGD